MTPYLSLYHPDVVADMLALCEEITATPEADADEFAVAA